MELKEFTFEDEDFPDWPDRYAVLYVDEQTGGESEKYVMNAQDAPGATTIHPHEVDNWLHILTWIRAHHEQVERDSEARKAIEAGIAEKVVDPRELDDSVGVTEEDG